MLMIIARGKDRLNYKGQEAKTATVVGVLPQRKM